MRIKIGNTTIDADGYIPIPKENAVQFYHNKSGLDYIPPIKVDVNILSVFGNKILLIESEGKSDKRTNSRIGC